MLQRYNLIYDILNLNFKWLRHWVAKILGFENGICGKKSIVLVLNFFVEIE